MPPNENADKIKMQFVFAKTRRKVVISVPIDPEVAMELDSWVEEHSGIDNRSELVRMAINFALAHPKFMEGIMAISTKTKEDNDD